MTTCGYTVAIKIEMIPKHKLILLYEQSIFVFLEAKKPDSLCLLTLSSNGYMSIFPNETCSKRPSNNIYCCTASRYYSVVGFELLSR